MTLWILDTNHVTLLEHRHPNILKRIEDINEEDLAITIITAEEQIRGWFKIMNESNIQPARLVNAYKEFKNTLAYLRTVNILDFDLKAHAIYLELRKEIKNVGTKDLRIAAIALSVNGIVVTRNQKDFGKVPNLTTEDWTLEYSND
jgi:tRNA(fMet)-specific endonuclease VapC